jgi:hypothetical protein
MTEYRIKLDIPIYPFVGDQVELEGASAAKVGERHARLELGRDRFAVSADDGGSYEVEPAGDRCWRAVRRIEADEFRRLPRLADTPTDRNAYWRERNAERRERGNSSL